VNATDLQTLRQAIDAADDALIQLLTTRAALSRKAQEAKLQAGLPNLDPAREAAIRGRYERAAKGVSFVARAILYWCRHEG
jgi:chorismate mutase